MSIQASTRVAPPFCDPDQPPASYADYPQNFDMIDLPDQLTYWPLLRKQLERCSDVLWNAYHEADRIALRHQNLHRALTLSTALTGTLAVVIAIIQLATPPEYVYFVIPNLTILEAIYAVFAGVAVLFIVLAVKFRWQLGRHKAERYRQMKFAFLIDPEIWCGDQALDERVAKLRTAVNNVAAMTSAEYREWAEELDRPERPHEPPACPLEGDALEQLVEYYRAKRLVFQKIYFNDRSRRNDARDWLTGRLAPLLFFSSVACVLVHFGLDRLPEDSSLHALGHVFIFLAIALPTIGGGVRFYCGSHEFARNKVRYRVKEVGLAHLDEVLRRSSGADEKIRDMDFCEHELGLEHREWSRLMIETEVFP
jgi:hypothetical protein